MSKASVVTTASMYRNGDNGVALLFIAPTEAILIAAGVVELAFVAAITAMTPAVVPDLDQ